MTHGRSDSALTMIENLALSGSSCLIHIRPGKVILSAVPGISAELLMWARLCRYVVCGTWNTPRLGAAPLLVCASAHFRWVQLFRLDKHQRVCILIGKTWFLEITWETLREAVPSCAFWHLPVWAVIDSGRVFLRYQRHLSKISPRFWQLPCTTH